MGRGDGEEKWIDHFIVVVIISVLHIILEKKKRLNVFCRFLFFCNFVGLGLEEEEEIR